MGTVIKYYGDKFLDLLADEITRRIAACCVVITNGAKELVSIPGTVSPKAAGTQGRGPGGRFRKLKRVYHSNPSAEGQPPHKQFGHLRRSLTYEVKRNGQGLRRPAGRVGTNYLIARYLEMGTRFMKRRPFLGRAAKEAIPTCRSIMGRPM